MLVRIFYWKSTSRKNWVLQNVRTIKKKNSEFFIIYWIEQNIEKKKTFFSHLNQKFLLVFKKKRPYCCCSLTQALEHNETHFLIYFSLTLNLFSFYRGLTDESEILKFLQHGTLVGLLPVPHPILIRKYQANTGTTTWFRTYMWGVIYLRSVKIEFLLSIIFIIS